MRASWYKLISEATLIVGVIYIKFAVLLGQSLKVSILI